LAQYRCPHCRMPHRAGTLTDPKDYGLLVWRTGLGEPLTARDARAPHLDSILTLPDPTNVGPTQLKALPYAPSPKSAAIAQNKPLNGMQKALVGLAASMPTTPGTNLEAHLADLIATGPKASPAWGFGERPRRPKLCEKADWQLLPKQLARLLAQPARPTHRHFTVEGWPEDAIPV
jgi:hypothetical protein